MTNSSDSESRKDVLDSYSGRTPYHVLFISFYNAVAKGVRYLSSILKENGYKTSIILFKDYQGPDTRSPSLKEYELLIDKIRALRPDMIGLSCPSSLCSQVLRETSKLIKTNFSYIPLICGGACITTSPVPEQFLSYCDYLFLGECEDIIVDIVQSIGSNADIHRLPNLCYRDGLVYKINDLKSLSSNIDISYFPDLGGKDKFLISNDQILCIDPTIESPEYAIISSRGCPYNCSYCCNPKIKRLYKNKGKFVRIRSTKNVIEELTYAKTKLNDMKVVRFWDDIFPDDEDWVKEFCFEYKRIINLPFIIWSHPLRVNRNNFDVLVKAGLRMVVIGIQHGSQRIRNEIYHRYESDEDIIEASKILFESGVPEVYFDFILDSPFETVEDLKATYNLCKKLYKPFKLQFHSLNILPGTEIEKMVIDKGLLTSNELKALQSKPLEEQFKSILWYDVSQNKEDKNDEFTYWKRKIYESQFKIEVTESPGITLMESVLLSGYYGFGNLGDELILKNIARIFREAGFSSIYAVSGDVEYSKAKHPDIEFIDRDDYSAVVNIVRRVNLVVLGGGGLFQDYNRLETAGLFESPKMGVHSYINVPLVAHIYGKPIAYLFQGVGPLFSEDSRNFAKYAFSLSHYISVRDKDSTRLLEELGIREVVLSADPTFLYPLENVKTKRERSRVGISLRQWVDKSVEEKIVSSFTDFLNIAPEDYDFYFISFQDHDDQNTDSSIYERIRSNLKRPGNFALIRSKDYSLEDIEKMIADLDFLIGMRLHSIILAIKYGIPFLAIPYWNKVDNLLAETGLEDLSISIKEISGEKIRDQFLSIIPESSDIKKRIKNGMAVINQRIHTSIDTMKDFFTDISGERLSPLPTERPDEKAPLPVDWLNYKAYQERLKRQFYKNRYSRFTIDRILRRSHYKKIIFYPSPILWDVPLFQRPHQIFKELSQRGYLIFFLPPDPVADRAEPIREINENLYLIKDIDILYGLRNEAIILWITWTANIVCKELFPNSIVVYDWIDELDIFGYYSKFMEIDHRKLLCSANIVLATSDSLLQEAKTLRPDALLVPNGVTIEDFKVEGDLVPEDMANLLANGKPVIGFYGLLGDWRVDYDLVNNLCGECRDLNFVLIGPCYDGSTKRLKPAENLFLLGPKKYEELRYYLKQFDVAIIPYKVDRITNSVFPVKLCEYMAGGKPIVTTNMKECRKFKSVLVSESGEDFIQNIRKALLLKDNADYLKVLTEEAYSNRWEDRVDKIISALESERLPEPAGKEQIEERLSVAAEEIEAMQKLLDQSIYEIEVLNSKLTQTIVERDALSSQFTQVTGQFTQVTGQLNQTIAEKDNLWNQLNQTQSVLNGIYSSNFWKVASLYYRVRDRSIVLRSIHNVLKWLKRKIKSSPYPEYLSKFRLYANRYGARKAIIKSLLRIIGRDHPKIVISAIEEKHDSSISGVYAGGIKDRVSVVLPVYNQANYLKEAIDGFLNQTYKDIELIIINDGSNDGVEEVLDGYVTHSKVKIFTQENQKLPRALNNGFDHATGEFLTWTSADNIMLPNQIEDLVRFLKENPDADMVFSDYQAIDDRGMPLHDPTFRPHNQDKDDRSIMRLPNIVTFENLHDSGDNFIGPSFMYRRHVAKIIGDYVHDTFGGEDYDYWLRLNSLFNIKRLNKILYKYRVHENTLNARAKELNLFENIRRLLERDRLRRAFYQKGFNIIWVGFEQKKHLLNDDDKILLIFKNSLKNNSEVIKNLESSNVVSICVIDEKMDEYSIDDVLKTSDYIITNDINDFDVLSHQYGDKLFNLENVEGNLELLVKMANSNLFNRGMGLFYEKKPASIYFENRRLNIAFQVENFDKGGLEQVVYDLATHIDRERFNLCGVIVVNQDGLMGDKFKSKGMEVLKVNNNLDAYKSLLKNRKIDIVNSHYSYFGLDKASELGIGVIETVHNNYTWLDSEKIKEIRYSGKLIDKYIAVSRQVKNYHRRRFGIPFSRIDVIPNGLNLEGLNGTSKPQFTRNSLGYNESDFIFLNVASFNGIKCHHLMISAVKELIGNYLNIKLIFIGDILDRGLYNDIWGRIKAEALEGNIKIMDFLDRPQLKDIYQMADCFILPSIQEGWSIAAMEAMYFNLPIILTDIGSARDIIEDNDIGIMVDNPFKDILTLSPHDILELSKTKSAKNLSELKKAMLTIYKNEKWWKEKARKGRGKVSNKFSIERMVKRYEEQFIRTYYLYRKE